jgi:hypothetical protein
MYNPGGDDNNFEYIEIYSDEFESITNFTVSDLYSKDTLIQIKSSNNNYHLIVEEVFNHSNINASIYSVGATIGNQLNNDEDIIVIENNESILDAIHYYSSWGANGNNKSLCLLNEEWIQCIPTPGKQNHNNITYNLSITEFLADPYGNDDAAMPEGEWIEIKNYGDDLDLVGFKLKDLFNRTLTISSLNTYSTIIHSNNHLVVYTNGLFGLLNNEDLEEISLYSLDNILIDTLTYSHTKEGESWAKIDGLWKLSNPTPNEQNPTVIITEPNLNIEKVYTGTDNSIKFGEAVRIKINVNKGNSTKNTLSTYIISNKGEKITPTTKTNIPFKYTNYELTIPIQLFSNYNQIYTEGEYIIVLEGFDITKEEKVNIWGNYNLCKTNELELEECTVENIINLSNYNKEHIIYRSSSKKIQNIAPLIFCFILIIIILQTSLENGKNKN